ncbi:MAG TPA: phycobilisome degradation protein NblA [Cyanobacteria bacterium UBA8553]|nr:phycobilisome degradation protein NblA [Cyanobacteria bacterium UBA8553]HAJ61186.1 phycobilisome degradation protein NblA [Cyanobacteria bacterium UBA8543]
MELKGLTLEQQFKLKVLETQIQGLSQEQAQKLLLAAVRLNLIKDNIIKHCAKDSHNTLDVEQLKLASNDRG